mmetsp:Transcript_96073/g.220246  ORF Transcript_96073/g.220246 Transcript_96073/m.220246 type:complete len:424 (+) Transcript_96073:265-1536(+)
MQCVLTLHGTEQKGLPIAAAFRVIYQHLEQAAPRSCALHVNFLCLGLCGPGTARVYEGASSWLGTLASEVFDSAFTRSAVVPIKLRALAFKSASASNGYRATHAWLRAIRDHCNQYPDTRLKRITVFFRSLPLVAEFDDETRRHSQGLPEHFSESVEDLADSFFTDLIVKRRMYLDVNFRSAFAACTPKEDMSIALKTVALALDFSTAPANFVAHLFEKGLSNVANQSSVECDAAIVEVLPRSAEEVFTDSLAFCGAAEQLYAQFFNESRMTKEKLEVRDGIQVEMIDYVDMVLRCWFSCWDSHAVPASDCESKTSSAWRALVTSLLVQAGCDSALTCTEEQRELVMQALCPILVVAMDKAVSSFLRQYAALDYVLKVKYPSQHTMHGGFVNWLEARVPSDALKHGMTITSETLCRYRSTLLL